MKNFVDGTPSGLLDAARVIVAGAGGNPGSVGLTPAVVAALGEGVEGLEAAVVAQARAKAEHDAAVAAKDARKAELLGLLRGAARSAYADAAVGDALLRGIGLAARRAGGVRPQAIPAPERLMATALPDARVRLRWDRNGNPQGTTFQIEWAPEGGPFTMVDTTTRASIVLPGHAPGVEAWFRVTAKRAGLVSPASNAAVVYAGSRAALRRAA